MHCVKALHVALANDSEKPHGSNTTVEITSSSAKQSKSAAAITKAHVVTTK